MGNTQVTRNTSQVHLYGAHLSTTISETIRKHLGKTKLQNSNTT